MVLFEPSIVTRTRCRFGLNWRRLMPVTLVPTPPRYFALPRSVIELPMTGPLPQTSQTRAMTTSQPTYRRQKVKLSRIGKYTGNMGGRKGSERARLTESEPKNAAIRPYFDIRSRGRATNTPHDAKPRR